MSRTIALLCLSLCLVPLALAGDVEQAVDQEGVELAVGQAPGGYNVEVLVNDIEREIVIRVDVSQCRVEERNVAGELYSIPLISGTNNMQPAGQPMLPSIGMMVQIGDEVSIEDAYLEQASQRLVALQHPVLPAQGVDEDYEDIWRIEQRDPKVYEARATFPEQQLYVRSPEILRDVRFVQIGYVPVVYNPADNTLVVSETAEIHLRLKQHGRAVNPLQRVEGWRTTASWGQFYQALFVNYENPTDGYDCWPERYVVVAPDSYVVASLITWIDWKIQQGFDVRLIKLSEIGYDPTDADVYSYLYNIYYSPDRFDRILFVGTESSFPLHWTSGYVDDNWFAMLAGYDYLPDVWIGRLVASNTGEMDVILSKILYWEQTPNTESDYYNTAVMACSGLYPSQETTKERVHDYLADYRDYETVHTMYDWSSGSATQVQNWCTDGCSILNYRGEGWTTGWTPGHAYSFNTSNVHNIYNNNKLTVVTSIGCGVAMFGSNEECFGEAWVTNGTVAENRGAVAFCGPTGNTHTTFNNWMDRGIYYTMCKRDMTRIAEAFLYGKIYMRNWFWQPEYEYYNELEIREFHYLGTPDLQVRTEIPAAPRIYYTFSNSSNKFWVYLENAPGVPSAYGLVKLESDGLLWATQTDRDGVAEFPLPPSVPGRELEVTVNGFNFLPTSTTHEFQSPSYQTLLITEIKPDIPGDGINGDLIELYNYGDHPVPMKGWILSDLDKANVTFCEDDFSLDPGKFAVVCFQGSNGTDSVQLTGYGLYITRQDTVDYSSLEDEVVLRNPVGHVIDALCYTDRTGTSYPGEAWDLTYLCGPSSPFEMSPEGWWHGDDEVTPDTFEDFAIDWSVYAGNGGNGSIQRKYVAGEGFVSTPGPEGDSPDNFLVTFESTFGDFPSTLGAGE